MIIQYTKFCIYYKYTNNEFNVLIKYMLSIDQSVQTPNKSSYLSDMTRKTDTPTIFHIVVLYKNNNTECKVPII